MAADAEQAGLKMEGILEGRPVPKKPYSVKAVAGLSKKIGETLGKIAGDDLPVPEWTAPEGMKGKLVDPESGDPLQLPPEVYLPVAVFSEAIRELSGADDSFEKYLFDPSGLDDDTTLRAAGSKLVMAGKDKKLASALMKPMGDESLPEEEMPGPPAELDDDEEYLAEGL